MSSQVMAYSLFKWLLVAFERREGRPGEGERQREVERIFPSMRESLLLREEVSGDLLPILLGQATENSEESGERRRKFVRFIALLDVHNLYRCFQVWRNRTGAIVREKILYEERYRRELDESVEKRSFGKVRRKLLCDYVRRWRRYTMLRNNNHLQSTEDEVTFLRDMRCRRGIRGLMMWKKRADKGKASDTLKWLKLRISFACWREWQKRRQILVAATVDYDEAQDDEAALNARVKASFARWRGAIVKEKTIRSAEWSLLMKRARQVLSYHFGLWYIAFIYRFRLDHAERKWRAKTVFRSKSRILFAWRFLFERSVLLREGGSREDLPLHAVFGRSGSSSSSSSSLSDRRRLLTSKADDARYQRLGSLLLLLRAKLCRGRDGLRALERWRKYNAAVAVAVLIQKRWRGHRIRCASSRYRRRIEYCRAYGVHYHSLLQSHIKRRSRRSIFDILLSHHALCRSHRQQVMGLCKERQALDVMKDVLFTWKWRSARFTQVAVLFRETTAFQKFWNNLRRICADSVTISASEHFANGRVLGMTIRTLKLRSELGLKHRALLRGYLRDMKGDTLLRLLKWAKFDRYRRAVQGRSRAFLRIKFLRHFESLRRILALSSSEYRQYEVAKGYELRRRKSSHFQILKDQTKSAEIMRVAADLCFLRLAGPKCLGSLRKHSLRKGKLDASFRRAIEHQHDWCLQRYLEELHQSFCGHRKHARKMSCRAQSHHAQHHLRVKLAHLRQHAQKNALRRLLDSDKAKPDEIEKRLELEGAAEAIYGGEGIRPRFILVSPLQCPLPEYYHRTASRDIKNNKKGGTPPKYFDTDTLRKLSVSKEFWANDDPRRRTVLRVFTSKREVVFGMVLRQLHVNAFSPYSTYRRAMQVAVFERKSGTPSRDKALQCRLRKLRLRIHADKLVAVHSWLMKRDVFLAVWMLRYHARLCRTRKTFYATTRVRGSLRSCLNRLLGNAKARQRRRDLLYLWKVQRSRQGGCLVFLALKEYVALNGHDRAVACVAKRQHVHHLAVKSFFNQLMWILRPRRKLKRIARKFHLRPLMATWLAETASSFEVFHVQQRVRLRLKKMHFRSWFHATLQHMKLGVLSEEVRRRCDGRFTKEAFLSWIEAIVLKQMSHRFDAVRKNHVTHLKRRVIKNWNRRCALREAHYWTCTKAMFKSLYVHTSWIKHQVRCLYRAASYFDRLMEVTLFRKMLHKYRVKKRLMQRATHGHDYLILTGCKHAIRKWRYRTYFRISYKKKALSLLQQQSLGIGTFSGHYSELVITTSSAARRLGLIPKETLSHGHGHVSYHERLIAAMKIQMDARKLKRAIWHWSKYHYRERSKSTKAITSMCFHQWKMNVKSASIQRHGMIARLRETLNRTVLTYALKGFKTNLVMKRVSLVLDTFTSRRYLSVWQQKTSRRCRIRRMLSLLLDGHHFLTKRLYFRFWKALNGPAWRSEKVFFQETIFRRWRCCFVAMRHYRINLLSQVFVEWSGLVFGRLAARFNVRRGRRIAARLLTRIRQQRCSKLRVFFNRWAEKAEVPLPGLRLKKTGRASKRFDRRQVGSSTAVAPFDAINNPNPNLTTQEDLISKESLHSWRTHIKNARVDETLPLAKKFSLQSVASYKELAASTIIRSRTVEKTAAATSMASGVKPPYPPIEEQIIQRSDENEKENDDVLNDTNGREEETENDIEQVEEDSEDRGEMTISDLV